MPASGLADGPKESMSMAIRDPWARPPRLAPFALDIWPEWAAIRNWFAALPRGLQRRRIRVIRWIWREAWIEDGNVHVRVRFTPLVTYYPRPNIISSGDVITYSTTFYYINGILAN
jgi:hypothetical protein